MYCIFVIFKVFKMNFTRAFEIMELIYFKILDTLLFLSGNLYNSADTVNIN